MKQACEAAGVTLDQKSFWQSVLYGLRTGRRTPVILVDGVLVSQGRIPRPEELEEWIGTAA